MSSPVFDPTKYTKSKFLKGSDLPKGRAVTVTISKVYEHTFDQTQETKPALDFSDFDQGMVLNKSQVTTLIDLFGTDVRVWVGQQISLLPVPSNYQGKPTVLITAGEATPTFGGKAPTKPTGYSREDAQRDQARRQPVRQAQGEPQPAAVAEPPAWASAGPGDDGDNDMPF